MAAELIGHFPAGSEEWHAARAGVMTGSRIAAVLGLSPWESRFSLWHRMAGLAAAEQENDEMHWGTLLEPVIREEFARRHHTDGWNTDITGTWRHAERTWQVVNPDGLVWPLSLPELAERGGRPLAMFEAKTARAADGWGEPGTDEIPVYYRAQVLWGLDVLGLEVCHLAVLIAGSDYREYRIEHSPDEAEYMRTEARAFLDSLAAGQRPDIDAHSSTYQVVRELHPDIDDERIDLPAHIARPYLDALAAFETAQDEKQRATAAVLDHMGRARRAMWDGQQIAMRVPGRGNNPPYLQKTTRKAPGQKVSPAA